MSGNRKNQQRIDRKEDRKALIPQDAARREALERQRRKQIRRRIVEQYSEMQLTEEIPVLDTLMDFLAEYLDEIDLVREALSREKHVSDPWAIEIWKYLNLPESELREELTQIRDEKAFAVEAAKMRIRHDLIGGFVINVSTTVDGPRYDEITAQRIKKELEEKLSEDEIDFEVKEPLCFSSSGRHTIELLFEFGDPLTIEIDLELQRGAIPEDIAGTWNQIAVLPEISDASIMSLIREMLLEAPSCDKESQVRIARVLKTSYAMGFFEAVESQRLLQRWRAGEQSLRLIKPAEEEIQEGIRSIPFQYENVNQTELEKLQVLDLPPLVAHDLLHATVDLNVLQHLFSTIPDYKDLSNKKIEDFSERDIFSLSPGTGYWNVSDLRPWRQRSRPIDSRTIAKILLNIARLQFERLSVGTSEASIRICLSNYSTRMGEYLVAQHGRFDLARDYYLEAISLNINSSVVEFPTRLLFWSLFSDKRVPSPSSMGLGDFLRLLDDKRWRKQEIQQTAIRAFLELGMRHFPWASRWFRECSQPMQKRLLTLACSQLDLGEIADFSDCVRVYRQRVDTLQTLLRQMGNYTSLHAIAQCHAQLEECLAKLGFLLSPTNSEIASTLMQAAESVDKFLCGANYSEQRSNADTAINSLERVLTYGADNYTSLWAEHFGSIANRWREVIGAEISAIARDISPNIEVTLAEDRISLTNGYEDKQQLRVIFGLRNWGAGKASRLNIRFYDHDGKELSSQKQAITLEPGEYVEDYFVLEPGEFKCTSEWKYVISYYDLDAKLTKRASEKSLRVFPLIESPDLEDLAKHNPFRHDQEVDDERMFVGRDQLLEEVLLHALEQPRGSLLMLHGQKRVGKSSFLIFLERKIDQTVLRNRILGVRITWLDYTAHTAPDLMSEIASAIREKYRQRYDEELSIPSREDFRHSYSLAFNDLLKELRAKNIKKLVLMWDEFDGLVHHIDNPEMKFGRIFFEYLRGLSKQKDVTLVLTGGELMPIMFERWGEVFNHDRTWRITYLSSTDGSVDRLIRNDYVKDILEFSDEAVQMIKEYSACNPFFVQMLGRELVVAARCQKSSRICRLDVEEIAKWVVQRVLDPKHMHHLYAPRLESDPLDLVVIGVTVEVEKTGQRNSYVPQTRILSRIVKAREDEVITRIGELVRRDILERNPDNNAEVRIKLPLFRDWFHDNQPEYRIWANLLRR